MGLESCGGKVDRITKSVAVSSSIFPQKYYDEKLEKNLLQFALERLIE
jgi:hypothetical protein